MDEGEINISSKFVARKLRSNSTDAELELWSALKNRQLKNSKFRRQAFIGKYIVNFVCLEKTLIILQERRGFNFLSLEGKGLR